MSKRIRLVVTLGILLASASAWAKPAAGAAAPACDPPSLRATPATGAPVPLDARLLLQPIGCFAPDQAKLALKLTGPAEGAPTPPPTATDVAFSSTSISAQNGTFISLKPQASLEPSTGYTLTFTTPNFGATPSTLLFTTGSTATTPTSAIPTVEALSGSYSESNGTASGTFRLRIAMPQGSAVGGALYVDGRTVTRDALGSELVSTDYLATDVGPTPVEISLYRASVDPGKESCFTVVYEDPSGRLSATSEKSCVVATRAPDPTPTTTTTPGSVDANGNAVGTGCSAAPTEAPLSSSALLGALGMVGLLAWRRREKR
jgi:MYXO-CTERM domain-containing protein